MEILMNFKQVVEALKNLTIEEKRALNRILVDKINTEIRENAAVKSAAFTPGDIIEFFKTGRGRHAGLHYIKVMGFNRARTAIVGPECDKTGKELEFAPRWTISCTNAKLFKKA
jgi:hypothetical protein